jgi:hypothetical protein
VSNFGPLFKNYDELIHIVFLKNVQNVLRGSRQLFYNILASSVILTTEDLIFTEL